MKMTERNFCAEAGCRALCCANIKLEGADMNEIQTAFPDALELDHEPSVKELGERGPGVYFVEVNSLEAKPYEVFVIGKCPNLTQNFKCAIYKNRPSACKNFQIGAERCNNRRKKFLLPPVKRELVLEARRTEREADTLDFSNLEE